MNKSLVLLIPVIIVLLLTSGCYTVLRHSDDEAGFSDYDTDYDENYGTTHYYYPDYWTSTPRWGSYYAVPWWWDHDYYYSSGTVYYDGDGSPRSSGGQKAQPRSRFRDTAPVGGPNISRGTPRTGPSTPSSNTGTSAKQKPKDKKSEATSKEVKTKENKETNKTTKPTRRTGRWHKK